MSSANNPKLRARVACGSSVLMKTLHIHSTFSSALFALRSIQSLYVSHTGRTQSKKTDQLAKDFIPLCQNSSMQLICFASVAFLEFFLHGKKFCGTFFNYLVYCRLSVHGSHTEHRQRTVQVSEQLDPSV